MFVVSIKTGKKKLVLCLAAVLLAVTAALAAAKLLGGGGQGVMASLPAGETNEERILFLESFGWQLEPEPEEVREVAIPAQFNDVYEQYNQVQKAQGMDLAPYAGRTCRQWVYTVTNYPSEEAVRATLLVLEGKIIGGDLSSAALDGFLCGFAGQPGLAGETAPQPASQAPASSPPQASGAEGASAAASAAPAESAAQEANAIPEDAWPVD